jgi:flagellar biosynthesis GTPase FlhF
LGDEGKKALQAERKQRAALERELAALKSAQEAAAQEKAEAEQVARGEFEKVRTELQKAAERLKAEAAAARADLDNYRSDSELRKVAAAYVNADLLDDALALNSGKFQWKDGAVISDDGQTPAEYFAALVKAKPIYAIKQNQGYGVQGGPVGSYAPDVSRLTPRQKMELGRKK